MSEETTKPQAPAGYNSAIPRADKDAEPGARRGKRRRKVSYLTTNKIETVDYKEVNILRRFMNERGKILPARQTGNTAKQQRMIAEGIRRAREMALLPFVVTEMTPDRGGYGPRRERFGDRGDRGDRGGYRDRAPRNEEGANTENTPSA